MPGMFFLCIARCGTKFRGPRYYYGSFQVTEPIVAFRRDASGFLCSSSEQTHAKSTNPSRAWDCSKSRGPNNAALDTIRRQTCIRQNIFGFVISLRIKKNCRRKKISYFFFLSLLYNLTCFIMSEIFYQSGDIVFYKIEIKKLRWVIYKPLFRMFENTWERTREQKSKSHFLIIPHLPCTMDRSSIGGFNREL